MQKRRMRQIALVGSTLHIYRQRAKFYQATLIDKLFHFLCTSFEFRSQDGATSYNMHSEPEQVTAQHLHYHLYSFRDCLIKTQHLLWDRHRNPPCTADLKMQSLKPNVATTSCKYVKEYCETCPFLLSY